MSQKHRNQPRQGLGDRQRAAIAQEAARILAENHSNDFAMAKRKASERLGQGVYQQRDLPNNQEIEQALLEYRALFSPEQHRAELSNLRNAALAAMKLLATFEPRLVGSVLSGSASQDSRVILHLFADRAEDVYMALLAKDIPVEDGEKRLKIRTANGDIRIEGFPSYSFYGGDVGLELVVMPLAYAHQPVLSPVDGKPMQTATRAQLQQLIAQIDPH